ncbi:MAG: succinate dehydrogenase / fumarate reductase cytochrome b subunit [Planctomycetota bacterium]|jgi:succinate dehydrogenase / fumarate reductase cytochrome b subunit
MLRPIGNALASSLGRKFVLGATGLMLVGFLVEHLIGNYKLTPTPLVGGTDGSEFDAYVDFMNSLGIFKVIGELGLAALFVIHVFLAVRLTMENREARKQRYECRANHGGKTPASASMFVTGSLILGYLIKHLIDFRFNDAFHEAPAATVVETLSDPLNAFIYIAVSFVVGIHLSHGFRSAFQSLGLSHPQWNPVIEITGKALAALFAIAFAWIPIYFLFFNN